MPTNFDSMPGYYSECSGSILHETLVLTAAHCVVLRESRESLSLLGSPASSVYVGKTSSRESEHRIIEAHFMKEYDYEWTADVALVRTETKMVGPGLVGQAIQLGCLPREYYTTVEVIGYGHEDRMDESSLDLTAGTMQTAPNSVCRNKVPEPYDPDDRLYICLISTNTNAYTVRGDSGGPIVYKGKVVGLVKGGSNHITSAENISVYNFRNWLQRFRNRNFDYDDTISTPPCQ